MKIFILGCSFTKYYWPTWVNMIQKSNPNIEIINLARPGIGNVRIFYRLQELFLKKIINKNDKVVVVWTSWHREDRFVNEKWAEEGNVFNAKCFGNTFTKNYWSNDYDIIKNCSAIISANDLYNITAHGAWLDLTNTESYQGDNISKDTNYNNINYKFKFYNNNLPKFIKFNHSTNTYFGNKSDDRHPDILCHYDYALKMSKKLCLNLDNLDYWQGIQSKIEDSINLSLKQNDLWETIQNTIKFTENFNDPIELEN